MTPTTTDITHLRCWLVHTRTGRTLPHLHGMAARLAAREHGGRTVELHPKPAGSTASTQAWCVWDARFGWSIHLDQAKAAAMSAHRDSLLVEMVESAAAEESTA
jgi:hypothetical protein